MDPLNLQATVDDAVSKLNTVATNLADRVTQEEGAILNCVIEQLGNVTHGIILGVQAIEDKTLSDVEILEAKMVSDLTALLKQGLTLRLTGPLSALTGDIKLALTQ